MLGFRTRVHGYENYAKGKQVGAVRDDTLDLLPSPPFLYTAGLGQHGCCALCDP